MSKREELAEITKGIDENHQKAEEFHQLAYDLEDKISETISAIIIEEELLAGSRWELRSNKNGIPFLEFSGKKNDPCFAAIKNLINGGYHHNYCFEQDVYLQFEDGSMNIYFPDTSRVKHYVDVLKLTIDTSPIKGAVTRLRKDLMALEMLCHQLDITV